MYKSLRVSNAVKLLSLFSWMAEDARFHAAVPIFIATTLYFTAALVRGCEIARTTGETAF